VNPGLRSIDPKLLAIGGPAEAPTSLRLAGRDEVAGGGVLAISPRPQLAGGGRARGTTLGGAGAGTGRRPAPRSDGELGPRARRRAAERARQRRRRPGPLGPGRLRPNAGRAFVGDLSQGQQPSLLWWLEHRLDPWQARPRGRPARARLRRHGRLQE